MADINRKFRMRQLDHKLLAAAKAVALFAPVLVSAEEDTILLNASLPNILIDGNYQNLMVSTANSAAMNELFIELDRKYEILNVFIQNAPNIDPQELATSKIYSQPDTTPNHPDAVACSGEIFDGGIIEIARGCLTDKVVAIRRLRPLGTEPT